MSMRVHLQLRASIDHPANRPAELRDAKAGSSMVSVTSEAPPVSQERVRRSIGFRNAGRHSKRSNLIGVTADLKRRLCMSAE
jgi:hypothetical protein